MKFMVDFVKRELERLLGGIKDLVLAGPASPVTSETLYRYQIMMRTRQMSRLSRELKTFMEQLTLPEDLLLPLILIPWI